MMRRSNGERHYFIPAFTGLATLLIGIGIGRFGYPPLIPSLVAHGWFSVSEADYLGAANLTGYILGSVMATRLNRWVPSVYLIRVSLVVTTLTFIGCAFRLAFPWYFLLRLAAGVTGGIFMVLTAPTLFRHTSSQKKGMIGGFIFSGVGIGIALAGTLIPLLVTAGLPATWLAFAITAVVLTILSWKGWPEGSNERHRPTSHGSHHKRYAVLNRTVFLLLVSYGCNAIGFVPHTVFWVDFISRGLGEGIQTGTSFWVLLGISAAVGPLLTGYLADKVGFAKSIRISLLVKSVGVLLPLVSTATWSLALSSVCVGSLALGISSLAAGRTAELIGPEEQKRVWGLMTITYSVSHAATAYLLTYLYSCYHSFYLLFIIGAVALIFASVADYLSSMGSKVSVSLNAV
ncbi:MAG TPA: YbfB/YjiJ family MFS transporter [Puia sp.]|nr:YbfB/YjiJ family MFS transporter [Puia sp.]